jgi:hypothetical protein
MSKKSDDQNQQKSNDARTALNSRRERSVDQTELDRIIANESNAPRQRTKDDVAPPDDED